MRQDLLSSLSGYRTRRIRFHDVWRFGDWRIKVYTIAWRDLPGDPAIEAAEILFANCLAAIPAGRGNYGVGYAGIHSGRDADFLFLDWWADENELHHRVWRADPGSIDFTSMSDSGPVACVWDLFVIGFERQAWLDHVLASPVGPDLDAWLDKRFEGEV